MGRRGITVLLVVCGVTSGALGDGLGDADQARALSDTGLAHYERGAYDEALAAFQASFALAPLPELQFNIGQTYRLKGDCPRAAAAYQTYLRLLPDAPNRARVEARIRELDCAVVTPPAPPLM